MIERFEKIMNKTMSLEYKKYKKNLSLYKTKNIYIKILIKTNLIIFTFNSVILSLKKEKIL